MEDRIGLHGLRAVIDVIRTLCDDRNTALVQRFAVPDVARPPGEVYASSVRRPPPLPLGPTAPPVALGVAAAAAGIALTTLLVYPLREVAPVVALGVLYLVVVLLVSSLWGASLGVATALASALAFNFFHIPPTGRFTIAASENWVALGVFLVVAIVASLARQAARSRAGEADERRREADLAAEMARLLLRGGDLRAALATAAQRLASALELPLGGDRARHRRGRCPAAGVPAARGRSPDRHAARPGGPARARAAAPARAHRSGARGAARRGARARGAARRASSRRTRCAAATC